MISFPNAKINLGLNVVSKRPDGYHNLETVFFPIPLTDALEVVVDNNGTAPYTWSSSGLDLGTDHQNNIIIKALHQITQKHNLPSLKIHLHKHIPFGAGLGGGSSDAAFMLSMLNETFELSYTASQLKEMAVKIGADCPFFIDNKPAYATGIGDVLSPVNIDLKGWHLALIKPPIHVSTPQAYAGIRPTPSTSLLMDDLQRPVEDWHNCIKNDFEDSVFAIFPAIKQLKESLYNAGAVYASMSGSGSSVFALFKEKPEIAFPEDHFCFYAEL